MAEISIGFNGRFFPNNWRPAREEIAFAARHGFAAIQFPGRPGGLTATDLADELPVLGEALQAAALTAVMEIAVRVDQHGRTPTGQTPLDLLRANLPAISTLPCRLVHWHLVTTESLPEEKIRQLERSLVPQFVAAVALAEAHGFRFGVEHNEPDLLLFSNPAACQMILEAVPGLQFVWDLNHTTPEQLPGFLALIPRLSMLHVSDTPLPDVNHHLPLGLGSIDFPAYGRALRTGGFAGPAILEIGGLPRSGGYGRDTDEALVDSQQRLAHALNIPQFAA
jgi:sugar phosphate isomerase/epimerase